MRRVLGTIAVMAVAGVGTAQAQPSDSGSMAEQLFNQARDLVKANRWAEACPKFEASLRYDAALGTRLNLATCYEHVGKLASAWGLYRESIELAKKAGDPKRSDYAQRQAAALEPRLAKLTISAPARPPEGLVVTRDGTKVEPGALGIALYIDAGAHEITAVALGFEPVTQTITIVDGKAETLVLPTLKTRPAEPATAGASGPAIERSTAPVRPAGPRSRVRLYTGAGIASAGLVVLGVGLVLGSKASSTYKDATALCGPDLVCGNQTDLLRAKELVGDARSTAAVSTVLVIAGGTALAAGAVVLLTAPRAQERTTARVVPVMHGRGAGLALTGGF